MVSLMYRREANNYIRLNGLEDFINKCIRDKVTIIEDRPEPKIIYVNANDSVILIRNGVEIYRDE